MTMSDTVRSRTPWVVRIWRAGYIGVDLSVEASQFVVPEMGWVFEITYAPGGVQVRVAAAEGKDGTRYARARAIARFAFGFIGIVPVGRVSGGRFCM